MSSVSNARQVWEDRFRKPTVDQLLGELGRSQAAAMQLLREQLLAVAGATEEITWKGVPWRWTIELKHEQLADKAWAYLVPQPQHALLVLPISAEAVSGISMKKLNKPVRDAIIHAREVEGVRWAQWEIESKAQAEVLVKIAKQQVASIALGVVSAGGTN